MAAAAFGSGALLQGSLGGATTSLPVGTCNVSACQVRTDMLNMHTGQQADISKLAAALTEVQNKLSANQNEDQVLKNAVTLNSYMNPNNNTPVLNGWLKDYTTIHLTSLRSRIDALEAKLNK